jgi:hypothetical protein
MNPVTRWALAAFGCLLFPLCAGAEPMANDYLTREGNLTEKLEVDVVWLVKKFPRCQWNRVDTTGQFVSSYVVAYYWGSNKGEAGKDGLKAIATALARYDLNTLEDKEIGADPDQTYRVTITYGKKTVTLTVHGGKPEDDPDSPTPTLEGRFAGIVRAVQALKGTPVNPWGR